MWSKNDELKAWPRIESLAQHLEEMASKKKQDEKNLKILREIVSLPCNKHCFDCQQRGPTYVNMTIGSFVCTSCSGLLRGLTPPHRVKSISMASFTDEEITMLKSRGNEYCRRVWLGLYDPATITDVSDESHVKSFMINKYERKRFYLDPSKVTLPLPQATKVTSSQPPSSQHQQLHISAPPSAVPRTVPTNSIHNNNHISNNGHKQDPFSPVTSTAPAVTSTLVGGQDNFANFDNNPIFNASASATPTKQQTAYKPSSQDLGFLVSAFSTPPLIPQAFTPNQNFSWFNPWASSPMSTTSTPVMSNSSTPSQDRYAALKDLDSLMKANTPSPWSVNGTGSVFDSSAQPPLESSPVPMFLSPQSSTTQSSQSSPGNPFIVNQSANENPWGNSPSFSSQPAAFCSNPFDTAPTNGLSTANNHLVAEGWAFKDTTPFGSPFSNNQSANFGAAATGDNNNKGWAFTGSSSNVNNPFSLGNGTQAKSSNPFL